MGERSLCVAGESRNYQDEMVWLFFRAVPSPVPSWQLGSGLRTQTAMTIGIKGSSAFVTAAKLHFSNRLQLSAV